MNEQYNLLAEFGRVDGQTVYLARERTTGEVAIARRHSDDPSGPLTISHALDAASRPTCVVLLLHGRPPNVGAILSQLRSRGLRRAARVRGLTLR